MSDKIQRKWPKCENRAYFYLSGLHFGPFDRFKGIHLYTQYKGPQLPCFEIKTSNLIEQFLRKWPSKYKIARFSTKTAAILKIMQISKNKKKPSLYFFEIFLVKISERFDRAKKR